MQRHEVRSESGEDDASQNFSNSSQPVSFARQNPAAILDSSSGAMACSKNIASHRTAFTSVATATQHERFRKPERNGADF
jgi:hypothetical protein